MTAPDPRPRLPIEEQLEGMRTTLTMAFASFEIWWVYANKQTRDKFRASIDRQDPFSRFDEIAHLWIAVLQLQTLFDKDRRTVRLLPLIDTIKDDQEWQRLRDEHEALITLTAGIKIMRDKVIAHKDLRLRHNDVYAEAQITHDKIKSALEGSATIFNAIAKSTGVPPFEPFPDVVESTEEMLRLDHEDDDE